MSSHQFSQGDLVRYKGSVLYLQDQILEVCVVYYDSTYVYLTIPGQPGVLPALAEDLEPVFSV